MDAPLPSAVRHLPVRADSTGLLFIVTIGQMILQFLCTVHVLGGLRPNHFLGFRVLLPLQREHEQLQRGVVGLISLLIFAAIVVIDSLLDRVNGPPKEVRVAHSERNLPGTDWRWTEASEGRSAVLGDR